MEIRKLYGSEERFLTEFNPSMQTELCSDVEKCYIGPAPSINRVSIAYSPKLAECWLEIQLNDLNEYSGCKDKMTASQIEDIARVVILNFGHLKVTELMLFFVLFKSGRFGRFYGVVDGLVITDSIREFMKIRSIKLDQLERKRKELLRAKEEEERKASGKALMSYAEWKRQNKIEDLK